MINPIGDRIVLQAKEKTEQTVGGIILADNAKEKPVVGEVVAVSQTSVGDLQAPKSVKQGDSVMYDKYAGQEVTIDGQDYLIVHEKDILGIL